MFDEDETYRDGAKIENTCVSRYTEGGICKGCSGMYRCNVCITLCNLYHVLNTRVIVSSLLWVCMP